MPLLTTTIEENSPLISYSSEWKAGSSADNAASFYSQSSFILTDAAGAVASFTFNGTGVQIFGAKRGNHGMYQVKVDDTLYPSISGKSSDQALFQQPLFSTTTLDQGLHVVTLTNQEKAFVDIDFITWQTSIGTEGEKISVNTFQDTDLSFTYLPNDSSWSTGPKNIGSFLGGSGHATTTPGASLAYTFKGEGVSLYGPVSPEGSTYSVQVDGGHVQSFTSNKSFYVPQTLLYRADSLGPGEHHLKLSVQPAAVGQVFAIDFATVLTTSVPSMPEPQSNQGISSLAAGTIAGMVISFILFLGLLGSIVYRRKFRARKQNLEAQLSPRRSGDKIQSPEIATNSYSIAIAGVSPTVMGPTQPLVLASAPREGLFSSYESTISTPVVINYNPHIPQRTNSESGRAASSVPNTCHPRPSSYVSNSTSPRITRVTSRKGARELPVTAGQSFEAVSEEELRSNQQVVEGQPQGFGGSSSLAHLPASTLAPQSDDGLPPDYDQATGPYHLR